MRRESLKAEKIPGGSRYKGKTTLNCVTGYVGDKELRSRVVYPERHPQPVMHHMHGGERTVDQKRGKKQERTSTLLTGCISV